MKTTSQYSALKKKWSKRHEKATKQLWLNHFDLLNKFTNSARNLVVGSAIGAAMLVNPFASSVLPFSFHNDNKLLAQAIDKKDQMLVALRQILPDKVIPLTDQQNREVSKLLSDTFHLQVVPQLNGVQLNRTYGLIGKEQHLMRYPGDTIATHFETAEDAVFADSGMAPGRGAWGYFTSSRAALTEQDVLREKYYIAVQTFLSPGWSDHVREYVAFYKYRKMLVVNPDNGKAMVVVIGDAGPGESTGKHLGGSPEVMDYLGRVDGAAKGPVLYFFIDDPNNTVPLGPITLQ